MARKNSCGWAQLVPRLRIHLHCLRRPVSRPQVPAKNNSKIISPWTADVQGPPVNSCVMNVELTDAIGRPVQTRRAASWHLAMLGCAREVWFLPAICLFAPFAGNLTNLCRFRLAPGTHDPCFLASDSCFLASNSSISKFRELFPAPGSPPAAIFPRTSHCFAPGFRVGWCFVC